MSLLYRKGATGQEVKRIQRALKIKADEPLLRISFSRNNFFFLLNFINTKIEN